MSGLNLASKARFCSESCFADNWPQHKKWHKLQALQQKELSAETALYPHLEQSLVDTENLLDMADPEGTGMAHKMGEKLHIAELEAEMARLKPGDRHGQKLIKDLKDSVAAESAKRTQRGDAKLARVVVEAQHWHTRGAYDKAAKKLLRGTDEFKDHPDLHHLYAILATVYRDSGDVPRAASCYLKCVELTRGSLASMPQGQHKARTDKEERERAAPICWARAVCRAWSALCTPPCAHMAKPDYLLSGFRATTALVLRVQSSRAKNEMDYETDLWDALTMRATAVAGSDDPDDQSEHRQLLERARPLARTPDQQAVLAALECDVDTLCKEGYAAVPGMPDSFLKKMELLRGSVSARPAGSEQV